MDLRAQRLRNKLAAAPKPVFIAYATAAAFATYFCMYAFRKPYDAATFDGLKFLDTPIDLKTALVIGQILGYTVSKFLGTKVCAEVSSGRRAAVLVALIAIAQLALVAFAVLPSVAPPVGLLSVKRTVSSPSINVSSMMGTVNVLVVSPTPNVSVPLAAV